MRRILQALLGLLPASRTKNRLLSLTSPRWRVHPTAHVSPCLLANLASVDIAAGCRIGVGSAFRDLSELRMGPWSTIGQLNWVTGTAQWAEPVATRGTLVLGERTAVMSRHYLDCAGGISIGDFSIVSGVRSTILTHDLDTATITVRLAPVEIGPYCLIGSGVMVTRGVTVTDRCIVGGGSVVVRDLDRPRSLYAGRAAEWKRDLTGHDYFDHERRLADALGGDVL